MKIVNGISSKPSSPLSFPSSLGGNIFSARVSHIILNDYEHPDVFREYGEWGSIGCIFFTNNKFPTNNKDFKSDGFARPLFPNNKIFPLKNELVYIIILSDLEVQSSINTVSYYYFQPINVWNNVHHNAIPDPVFTNLSPEFQKRDYQLSERGNVRRATDNSDEINLGKTFKEKSNIKNLQPFEGDIIYEGRWGQSIRFGSTVSNLNSWSSGGNDGDPIIVIRNGQYEDNKESWIPQIEDINQDPSSIYLTSNQTVPLKASSRNYNSYNSPPTLPEKYLGNQIILNSGRLVFNSKNDSILLSSFNSINLNSQKSVNVDAKEEFVVDSKKVLLGNKSATESIILGDKFLNDLQKLLTELISLTQALQTPIGTPTPYVPNIGISIAAVKTQAISQTILNQIETYKSKTSKTI
jgi:hypothetical protein